MQTTTNFQIELLDSPMIAMPTNKFLEVLDRTLDWKPMEEALQAMFWPPQTSRRWRFLFRYRGSAVAQLSKLGRIRLMSNHSLNVKA